MIDVDNMTEAECRKLLKKMNRNNKGDPFAVKLMREETDMPDVFLHDLRKKLDYRQPSFREQVALEVLPFVLKRWAHKDTPFEEYSFMDVVAVCYEIADEFVDGGVV